MSFEVVTIVEPDFVRLEVAWTYSFDEVFSFIDFVKDEANKAGRSRVLIDCRQFEGTMTEVERFHAGQRIAEVFGSRLKAALVLPGCEVTKLGEMAAVNRGAIFLVTDCDVEATDWLLN